jgi:hypothetical protein
VDVVHSFDVLMASDVCCQFVVPQQPQCGVTPQAIQVYPVVIHVKIRIELPWKM